MTKIRFSLLGLFTVNCLLFTSSCGYQFQVEGAGPVIGGSSSATAAAHKGPAPKLAVAEFENHTFEPNIEQKFTAYTRHQFSAGGGVDLVTEKVSADLLFKGSIITASTPSLSFNQDVTFEQRVIVTVKASVQDLRNGKEIWTQHSTGAAEFFLTNDLQFNRVLQNRALEQAGRQIAEDLASRFLAHLEAGATKSGERPALPVPLGTGQK